MAWVIILVVWAAVTVLVGYPYVEKIEKLRSDRDKFFSYICGRGLVDAHSWTCGESIEEDWRIGREKRR